MKISIWARGHKWIARFLIAGGLILLSCIGILTGILLRDIQLSLPMATMPVIMMMTVVAFIFYPGKHLKRKRINSSLFYIAYFFRQKTCDFFLLFSTFCMIVYIGNRQEIIIFNFWQVKAAVIGRDISKVDTPYKSISEFSRLMNDKNGKLLKWKERKKLLKQQVKAIRQSNETSKGQKIFLIVLSIVIAVGLSLLLAALACNLACSGSEALAIVVAAGGAALVAILLTYVIKKITEKKVKLRENTENPVRGH